MYNVTAFPIYNVTKWCIDDARLYVVYFDQGLGAVLYVCLMKIQKLQTPNANLNLLVMFFTHFCKIFFAKIMKNEGKISIFLVLFQNDGQNKVVKILIFASFFVIFKSKSCKNMQK